MNKFDPLVNVKFNLYGIDDNDSQMKILNTIKLQVHIRDSIEIIKRQLCKKLLDSLNDKNVCKFCFYKNNPMKKVKKSNQSNFQAPIQKKSSKDDEEEDDIEDEIEIEDEDEEFSLDDEEEDNSY